MYLTGSAIIKSLACALLVTALPQTTGAPNAVIPLSTTDSLTGQKDASGLIAVGPAPEAQNDQALQKRVAPVVVVAGIAAVKGAAILTKIAIEIGGDTIKNLGKWNSARETFTRKTTAEMWARNPDYNKYPAAICYNKGYTLRNPAGTAGLVSAELKLGLLHTDYDCMYMTGNNKFITKSEGGFINLSYTHNSRCTFDKPSGDLTCN